MVYCTASPDLFLLNASPNRVSHSSQLVLTHFLLVLLDSEIVHQQIMYVMTLLDNLKSVFKILS